MPVTRADEMELVSRRRSGPDYRGFVARRYGPNAGYKIPRQSWLYWHMKSRRWFRAQASIIREAGR